MNAQDVVRLAHDRFGRKVALSSSFGAEDMVLIDMLMRVDPKARIVTLDTGRLPQETYNVMDATRETIRRGDRSIFSAGRGRAGDGGPSTE